MIVRGLDKRTLERLAGKLSLEFDNFRPDGRGFAFRLIPQSSRSRFARRSGTGRRLKATCYHGFEAFTRGAFEWGAVSVTTVGPERKRKVYRVLADFVDDLEAFASLNVGNVAQPAQMITLCECGPKITTLKQADILACSFVIIMPDHYRADGSCKCDDPDERERMIKEWEYTEADFREAGVI